MDVSKLSPMMQQYFETKENYKDYILFFRVGDFYEMFFDDAVRASRLLELTLTGKDCGMEERAPMCGIPYHASEIYIKKLIDLGLRVAICEQLTDPALSKGLVVRDVIKVVTPGTLTESSMLDESTNNYIGAVFVDKQGCSVCFADISTGSVNLCCLNYEDTESKIINELSRYQPKELLYNKKFETYNNAIKFIKEKLTCTYEVLEDKVFSIDDNKESLLKQFSVEDLSDLKLDKEGNATSCVCGLFAYIRDTQKALIGRFTEINTVTSSNYMGLDLTARRNLEITETMRNKEKRGSLLWVLDNTKTSMGKRLLRTYIEQPLNKPAPIISRLNAVEQLCTKSILQEELSNELNSVYDIERLMTRVMYRTATPRDLKALSMTAKHLPEIKKILSNFTSELLTKCNNEISKLDEISVLIENAIIDEPPANVKEGGVIKDGFNEELDELRHIINSGKGIITEIEQREKDRTGIKNLKIGYNRVFGYYIEVSKSNIGMAPETYIRKQTLTNCERYITEELKAEENKILGANEKILSLEAEIFSEVRDFIATKLLEVQRTASALAMADVLCSFAKTAMKNQYVKPEIAIDGVINIKDGRHPVVELMLKDDIFVPNDTYLDLNDNRMTVITGPNMSGKSTYMRQVALITLMAQIGSYVPASYAKVSIVDRIFTRVGASDDLTAGQSTFMVEMSEVADILKNATKQSLVILDEVGRGTSTFDGISIARAVAEQIANQRTIGCKTLFATHYHELISLENEVKGIKNYSVSVARKGDSIKFLRKIVPGGIDDSYGIEVAKLAGLPTKVIKRAKELLIELEKGKVYEKDNTKTADQISFASMSHEEIADRLRKTNVDELTAEEAKDFLNDLVKML